MNRGAPASSPWLFERVAGFGDKVFLHGTQGASTYAQLAGAVSDWRARLAEGPVPPGAVVALIGDYSVDSIALLIALVENRTIVVPVASATPEELAERLTLTGVEWVGRPGETPRLESRSAASPLPVHPMLGRLRTEGHAGLVLFSSGSTGRPKAMVHDLTGLLETYREKRARSLTLLVFLMADHIGGLNTLFTALASGATMVIPATRDPDEVGALIARHHVAVLPTSPTFLNLLLMSEAWRRHDLSSLRVITYGTEPMPEGLLGRLRATFPRVRFIQTFGTSETGITQTTSKSSDSTLLRIDDPGVEHRIVDGELWLRSQTQILGYLNYAMDSFTADGWFRSGDLVESAEGGFLRIVGRRTELINVGGEKVLPAEVESVLMQMPEISDCVVRGEPSPITGQIVCADVVLSAAGDANSIRKVVRLFCRERLAPFKVPVKVTVVPQTNFSDRFKKLRGVRAESHSAHA